MLEPTKRFSNRVDTYVRYRPKYPPQVAELLQRECGLDSSAIVADVGSGPGNLTELLLPFAAKVYAVEPNKEMREAGERLLGHRPGFASVDGTAEATTLADESVDLITAGQAFHWFDQGKARIEFQRILRPKGAIALIWNDRLTDASDFLREYEELLSRVAGEYRRVDHKNVAHDQIRAFLAPAEMHLDTFPNAQGFDLEGLRGRVLSSSYVPLEGETNAKLMTELDALFERHQVDGRVSFLYKTEVFWGR